MRGGRDGVAGRQIGQSSLSDRYIKDHLGSVQRVVRENGTAGNEYIYDSFGNLIYSSGTLSNQRLYTSRYFDTESGLYYYRARYYDSNTGRFISEDPIGYADGINLYIYVMNNPLNTIDPRGEKCFRIPLGDSIEPKLKRERIWRMVSYKNMVKWKISCSNIIL